MDTRPRLATFSIVACHPDALEWGVAVASKFLSVGAVVPWARAGVGAIATQSYANTTYGPAGLELMAQGFSAGATLNGLIAADEEPRQRQVGVVDAAGGAATYTGEDCLPWAGGRTGDCFAAQGNILAGPAVVDRMAEAFDRTNGDLVDRLIAALGAGQAAGGDSRGQQSAALLVVKPNGGYGGYNDRYVDLRVDDHPAPIAELQRLLDMHKLYMFKTRPEDVLPIDRERARLVQMILRHSGDRDGPVNGIYDERTQAAFWNLCGTENLEGRWREGPEIDRVVLEYLVTKYGPSET